MYCSLCVQSTHMVFHTVIRACVRFVRVGGRWFQLVEDVHHLVNLAVKSKIYKAILLKPTIEFKLRIFVHTKENGSKLRKNVLTPKENSLLGLACMLMGRILLIMVDT